MSWYPHDIAMVQEELLNIGNEISLNEQQLRFVRTRLGVIATVMTCRWLNDEELDRVAKPHIKAIVQQWFGTDSTEEDDE